MTASTRLPLIAIVGRTNVGKSTLFNAIVGERRAIVDELDGVTRDRHYALVTRYKRPFTLVDTGGILGGEEDELSQSVRRATERAIEEADIVIGVFDGVAGVHPHDSSVVELLRRSGKKVVWVVNKCEKEETALYAPEFLSLGIDSYEVVASAHRQGLPRLVELLMKSVDEMGFTGESAPLEEGIIRLAIVGKPNVGKSTLLNALTGEEKSIVSDIPGTTRDSVDALIEYEDVKFSVVDTAGLRKKARVEDSTLERYSTIRTLQVLAASDVVALLIDATEGVPSEQDAKIAALAHDRGRALMVIVNKWDAIEKNEDSAMEFEREIREVFKFAPYVAIVFISAKTGRRCSVVLETAKKIYEAARVRVKTSEVNETLRMAFAVRPPPVYRGEPIKLLFATQAGVAPPTFVLFLSHPKRLGYSYERHVKNVLRETYGFLGSDIKLVLKKRGEEDNDAESVSV